MVFAAAISQANQVISIRQASMLSKSSSVIMFSQSAISLASAQNSTVDNRDGPMNRPGTSTIGSLGLTISRTVGVAEAGRARARRARAERIFFM